MAVVIASTYFASPRRDGQAEFAGRKPSVNCWFRQSRSIRDIVAGTECKDHRQQQFCEVIGLVFAGGAADDGPAWAADTFSAETKSWSSSTNDAFTASDSRRARRRSVLLQTLQRTLASSS